LQEPRSLIRMRRSSCVLALILVLTATLSGCAVCRTYEKCGLQGCPGDKEITAQILSQFSQHLDLEPNAINVQTLDHVVYLNGLVSSGLEIYEAEAIARQVPGVTDVVNSVAQSSW
jgi:osmotically-inducible protein OsmY